ncbi:MAG TPA: CHAD domain-containing protein [Acidimicrobiales bacterium]|nr:CHAD domain-containing protein [Acidimicrobiales bacterium]
MNDDDVVTGPTQDAEGPVAAENHAEDTEVEWQFDALDLRPVERWLAALPSRAYLEIPTLTVLAKPTRRLVDRYMDTSDWRVGQAGFVLRTRQRGRAVEVTMKDRRPAEPGGLRRRLELTESLPSGLSSLGPDGPVGRRVHAVAGRRPLVQVLEVRTRRQPFSLRASGAEVAEIALDDTTILVGPHQAPARLRRVEVEVAAGWLGTLSPVVQDLRESAGLSPALLSKFEAGLLAAGLSVPGPPDVGPTDIPPDATLGDVAYAVVRRQVRELFVHEPGTRLGEDPEELHDMRVATRRLRAALDIFSAALPPRATSVREELGWIAAELGAVRDLDVQLEDMAQMTQWSEEWAGAGHGAALAHLRALLESERDQARHKLLDTLDSARWERLTAALVTLARQAPARRVPGARAPAAIAVPPLLHERQRAMRSAAKRARRSGIPHDFHRVRIRGKRLRYSLEFTSALYGQPALRFVKKLTKLQDALGRMQDAEVASSRLFSLATEPPEASLPPATVFVMGGIAERYRQESAHLREVMPKKLEILRGKAWQELVTTTEKARRHAETTNVSPYVRPPRTAPMPSASTDGGNAPAAGTGVDGWPPPAALPPAPETHPAHRDQHAHGESERTHAVALEREHGGTIVPLSGPTGLPSATSTEVASAERFSGTPEAPETRAAAHPGAETPCDTTGSTIAVAPTANGSAPPPGEPPSA